MTKRDEHISAHCAKRPTSPTPLFILILKPNTPTQGAPMASRSLRCRTEEAEADRRRMQVALLSLQIDPLSSEFFRVRPRVGGPAELSQDFPEVYNLVYPYKAQANSYPNQPRIRDYGNYQSHPLWHKLLTLHRDNLRAKLDRLRRPDSSQLEKRSTSGQQEIKRSDEPGTFQQMMIPRPLGSLTDLAEDDPLLEFKDSLQRTNCDDLFAVYLNEISSKVNQDYFKHVMRFILLFRECLNDLGWKKKYESRARNRLEEIKMAAAVKGANPENEPELYQKELTEAMKSFPVTGEFCEQCDAEFAPEVSNECVARYMEGPHDVLRDDIVDLTRNFCHWLYLNGFTCTRLIHIQQNSALTPPLAYRSSQESFEQFDI